MENDNLRQQTEQIKLGNTNLTIVSSYNGNKTILEIYEKMIDEFIGNGLDLQN